MSPIGGAKKAACSSYTLLGLEDPSVLSFFVWDTKPDLRIFAQSKTYMITNHVNLNDAFLYKNLWEAGILDIGRLVAAIERQSFDLIITARNLSQFQLQGALSPTYQKLMSPVLGHYRLASPGAEHRYYVRRDRSGK